MHIELDLLVLIIEPIIKAQNLLRNLKPSKILEKKICIRVGNRKTHQHTPKVCIITHNFFVHGQHQDVPGHLQTCLGQAIGQSRKKMLLFCLQ
jgi:hypothetical protein